MLSPITASPTFAILALGRLTLNQQRVYTYLLELVGSSRVPVYVPLFIITSHLKIKNTTVRKILNKFKREGIIDRFTYYLKDPKNQKIKKCSSYRIKVFPNQPLIPDTSVSP